MFKIQGVYYPDINTTFPIGFIKSLLNSNSNTIGFLYEIGEMNDPNGLINFTSISYGDAKNITPTQLYSLGENYINSTISSNGINLFAKLLVNLNYKTGVIGGTNGVRPNPTDKVAWFDSFEKAVLASCEFLSAKNIKYLQLIDDWLTPIFDNDPNLCEKLGSLIDKVHKNYNFIITSNIWTPSNQNNQITGLTPSLISKFDILGIGYFPKFTKLASPSLSQIVESYSNNPYYDNLSLIHI